MRRSGIKIMIKLVGLVKPLIHVMAAAIIMGVIGHLCAIFIPVFGGVALLAAMGFQTSVTMQTLFILIVLFAVLRGILRYTEQASNHYIAFKLLAAIRHKVFEALRKLAPAKLEGKGKGNLVSIITSDIELLEVFYAHTISPIFIAIITGIIMVIFTGSRHPLFGLAALIGYITVGCILPLAASRKGGREGMVYRDTFGNLNSFFLDGMRGLRESIQYQSGEKRLKELNHRTNGLEEKHRRLKIIEGNTKAATDAVLLSIFILNFLLGIYLYTSGAASFDAFFTAQIAIMSSFGPFVALSSLSNNLMHTLASGERVMALLEEQPETEEVRGKSEVTYKNAACDHIDFSYEDEKILENFSLRIPDKKIVGLHGKSGSGKSTLLKLLMRFWDVQKGEVLISGENVKKVNTDNLRAMEGFVTQETHLFRGTIAENIRIANPEADMEQIEAAAKKASIHNFIAGLPSGYDTEVGELGENFSGGERQRIGLARAFLHDAPLLLLDEPTSNLDSLNEGIILKSLKETCHEKTVVLVSHRISTLRIADRIIEMDGKRVS